MNRIVPANRPDPGADRSDEGPVRPDIQSLSPVILLSGHPWQGPPYGLHHLAIAIADIGLQVVFVEPPFSPLHLIARRRRGRRFRLGLRPSNHANIRLFSPFALVSPMRLPLVDGTVVLRNWRHLCLNPPLYALRRGHAGLPGLVIAGTSLFSALAFDLDAAVLTFRFADDERLFRSVPSSILKQTIVDMPRYDAILSTTEGLAALAQAHGAKRVIRLPNGFDDRHFSLTGDSPVPDDLRDIPPPRIVYTGAYEHWFDWRGLEAAARALRDMSFVLIGNAGHAAPGLPSNVHLLGYRDYQSIPAYLRHSDVGIIPFCSQTDANKLGLIDPLKLWEYLATGLPVVAHSSLSLPSLPGRLWQYTDVEGFVAAMKDALAASDPGHSDVLAGRSWSSIADALLTDLLQLAKCDQACKN